MEYDNKYWNNRYLDKNTPWNLNQATNPIENYIKQLKRKDLRILIPGGGMGHEAALLFHLGFHNTYLLDFAEEPLMKFKSIHPYFSKNQILCMDFFDLKLKFDLVIEQTFFCAIEPCLREKYTSTMSKILNPKGKLVGLLFNDFYNNSHPPFGATKSEYLNYFSAYFEVKYFDICYNSVESRKNKEFFFNLVKKSND
ncbi:MAG: SAM-dependent methyltransferase [Cytophagales bacterium]|nr:MAG: SAM-dependent methyltransferase [Cytophagales bacterium]